MSSKVSLNSVPPIKDQKETKISELVIGKPRTLSKTCPVETQSKLFPVIEDPCHKKKKIKKEKKPARTRGACSERLPKLVKKEETRQRVEAGEPFPGFQSTSEEKLPSCADDVALKCLQEVREANEGVPDYCTNAVGPSRCFFVFDFPSETDNNDTVLPEEEQPDPSHALQQWELWMKRKKRLQDRLSKTLGRSPHDLLIQQPDKRRKALEDKTLFHYAKIPEPDKLMGHPYRWRPEIRLRDKGDCRTNDDGCPQYFAVKTKSYQGIVPEMEFIGIPLEIQKEKGLVCDGVSKSVNSATKLWEESSYRKQRTQFYWKQMKKMKPHEIEMNELVVVGTKILKDEDVEEPPSESSIPRIEVSETDDERDESGEAFATCPDSRTSIFCLVIGEEEIKYKMGVNGVEDLEKNGENCCWQVDFGVSMIGSLVEKSLRVENKGTIAVRYDWISKKVEKTQSLNTLQPKHHEPWFFFNKNSGIFVPGQIYDLKFYYCPRKCGLRTETWYLKTKPPLFGKTGMGKILLMGVASSPEPLKSETAALEAYIRRRMAESASKDILHRILYIATTPSIGLQQIEYPSLFSRKILFEFHNSKHFYHSSVVDDLNALFSEVCVHQQQQWDLSLDSLLKGIKTFAEGKERDGYLRKVSEHARKLLRPNYVFEKRVKKYAMVYQVFCKMINSAEEDYEYFRSCVAEKRRDKWELGESGEIGSSTKSEGGQLDDTDTVYDIQPVNLVYFYEMFYIKIYNRMCCAVEEMVGILETRKLFKPWK